jgi:hypothetical protein
MAVACIFMPLYSVIAITEQVKQKKKIYISRKVYLKVTVHLKVYLKEKKKKSKFFFFYILSLFEKKRKV